MYYVYDDRNIFAKILRGEIPSKKVLETEHSLAFEDIHPAKPVHVLVIPKGPYVNYDHFVAEASDEEITDFFRTVGKVARETRVAEAAGGNGFRVLSNCGPDGFQEVPHLHFHVFGGAHCGPMIKRDG
ncbi:MAG: histidine triad nucleotide-binding protein [Pseudomonadota bacterium]